MLFRAIRRDTVEVPSGRYPTVVVRRRASTPAVRFSHESPGDFLDGATMDASGMNELLCTAITRRSLVMFEYGDLIRVVEPHRFGVNSAGRPMLSGWLRAGYSRSDPAGGWRNYLVSDIKALQLLDAPFAGTRPGYAAHDPRMREVFCQLTPSAVDVPVSQPFVVREPMPTVTTRTEGARNAPPEVPPARDDPRPDDRSDRGV